MRFKPRNEEFEKLDSLDERSIISEDGKLYHALEDLRSLSYCGMLKIAKVNKIKVLARTANQFDSKITGKVRIHNPRTGWTGYGASQCKSTLENHAFDVAVKKALRNAVRLSLPPAYLRKCLKHFISE